MMDAAAMGNEVLSARPRLDMSNGVSLEIRHSSQSPSAKLLHRIPSARYEFGIESIYWIEASTSFSRSSLLRTKRYQKLAGTGMPKCLQAMKSKDQSPTAIEGERAIQS